MSIAPFPLAWPEGFPRCSQARDGGQFRTTLSAALKNVRDSLRRFGEESGRAVFVKQLSSGGPKAIKDMELFPEGLRVREMPHAR